jgi:hypothetical protein
MIYNRANLNKAYTAESALDAYRETMEAVNAPEEDITDLIVNLLHLLDTFEGQASGAFVLDMVKTHYREETEA